MRLTHFPLNPALKGYIEKLWVFETDEPIPGEDIRLVVPNGLIKMVIPYRNGLTGKMAGCQHTSREHQLTLIGISDIPSNVETAYFNGESSGTIGVEFSPAGAYRILIFVIPILRTRYTTLTTSSAKQLVCYRSRSQIQNAWSKRLRYSSTFSLFVLVTPRTTPFSHFVLTGSGHPMEHSP